MRTTITKNLSALALVVLAGVTASGCGDKATNAGDAKVQKIVVGTGNNYEPYCYLDAQGKLAGYEYEVLKEVDRLLPQYEFEYKTSQFSDVLVALGAGQIDLAAHQYEVNDERKSRYLYATESYTNYVTYPIVLSSNDSIKTVNDLGGKNVSANSAGSNASYLLNKYNKEHPNNKINIINVENITNEAEIAGLTSGRFDAIIRTEREKDKLNKIAGGDSPLLKIVNDPLNTSSTYYLYAKGNTELQQAVDGALKQLRASGRLAEISRQVLGGDYTGGI